MSWLYSQALVEEYLVENFSDGEQSAPLNGSHIQQAYCAPDKMTDFSRLSRFGMTFKPLTESRGEELLTLYLAGFHAKTSAQQEKAQELTENEAGCGEKWHASFTKYDPDTLSWKTHQCSLLGDLEPFLETWPQWGLMRGGECWEQRTLEQTIRGTESGLSPNGVDSFHTPNCTGLDGGSNSRKALKKRQENWPTPDANCGQRGTQPNWTPKRKSGQPAQYTINQAVRDRQTWPTPRSCSAMAATITPESAWNEKRNPNLETIVGQRMFPTPTAHNAKECASPSEYNRNTPTLAAQVGGKLNPTWVEWLMGWPLEWTDLKPLETDKFHYAPQQPSKS
jgi:DNA (cytosine-5)-methyltransferase 1